MLSYKSIKYITMNKILFLTLAILGMSLSSVSAQGYYAPHHLPARGYANPNYNRNPRVPMDAYRSRHNQRQNYRYNGHQPSQVAKVAYIASEILRGVVIAERVFAPRCSQEYYGYFGGRQPNEWYRGATHWPRYMNNEPAWYYGTPSGNIAFYTSTHLMLGVQIANVQLIRDRGTLYLSNARTGRSMGTIDIRSGCHSHFEVSTSEGLRLVEVFNNSGICRVNYLNIEGNIIESYEIY